MSASPAQIRTPAQWARRLLLQVLRTAALAYVLACGWLYFMQRDYLYFPTTGRLNLPLMRLERDSIELLVTVREGRDGPAILYFGGNAEEVSQAVPDLVDAFPQSSIFAMHYRGYSGSGGRPSEPALVEDAKALFDHVRARHPRVAVIGRSLGSGIAMQLAAARPVERLVLVTPFDSIAAVAAEQFALFPVDLLIEDRYDSWRFASAIRIPTKLILAEHDTIIPRAHAVLLAEAFGDPRPSIVTLDGTDHNDIAFHPDYLDELSFATR